MRFTCTHKRFLLQSFAQDLALDSTSGEFEVLYHGYTFHFHFLELLCAVLGFSFGLSSISSVSILLLVFLSRLSPFGWFCVFFGGKATKDTQCSPKTSGLEHLRLYSLIFCTSAGRPCQTARQPPRTMFQPTRHARDPCGTRSGHVRDTFGTRSGHVRDTFGTRSGHVRDMLGTDPGHGHHQSLHFRFKIALRGPPGPPLWLIS